MAKHIEVIARGLLISQNSILVCRDPENGHCYLPGGHIEFGETGRAALARELTEECDLKAKVGELLFTDECQFRQDGKRRHEINFIYRLTTRTEMPKVVSREPDIEFEWAQIGKVQGFLPKSTLKVCRAAHSLLRLDVHPPLLRSRLARK